VASEKNKNKSMSAPHKLIWWVGGRRGENRKKKLLQGCKSNRNFYRSENRKWHILKGR